MEDLREKYEVVIGLEVHAQLKTKSKIFAPDSTEFGNEQNKIKSVTDSLISDNFMYTSFYI